MHHTSSDPHPEMYFHFFLPVHNHQLCSYPQSTTTSLQGRVLSWRWLLIMLCLHCMTNTIQPSVTISFAMHDTEVQWE